MLQKLSQKPGFFVAWLLACVVESRFARADPEAGIAPAENLQFNQQISANIPNLRSVRYGAIRNGWLEVRVD